MTGCAGAVPQRSYDHCHCHDYIRGVLCHSCNISMVPVDAHVAGQPGRFIEWWQRCPQCAAGGPWEPYLTAREHMRAGVRSALPAIGQRHPRDAALLVRQLTDAHPWLIRDLRRQRERAILAPLTITNLRQLRRRLSAGIADLRATTGRRAASPAWYMWLTEPQLHAYRELRSLADWVRDVIAER